MVLILLVSTFIVAFLVATIVVLVFKKPIDAIVKRVVPEEISYAWSKYLVLAIYVVGISGGARIWSFEKYLIAQDPYKEVVQLTPARWVLEIYDTIMGTLQSTAMLLLVFFVFALVAVVIVRLFESRAEKSVRNA